MGAARPAALASLAQEMLDHQRDVVAALAQRRQRDLRDVQAEEQIAAELPLLDQARRDRGCVAVRMRTSTLRVRSLPTRRSSPSCSTRSSLPCIAGRHLADLVEEQRAAVGDLEQAARVALGAGERAAHVAEQRRLQQRLGDGGAVLADERAVAARAVRMDGARDQLLAGAAFALDHDRQRRVGDAIEQPEQIEHARRAADDVAVVVAHGERLAVVAQLLFDPGQLLAPRGQLHLEPAVERLDLALAAAQLGQQARVLERDRGLLGEIEHQPHVVLVERALAQPVVDVDRAGDPSLDRERHREHRAQVQIGHRQRLPEARVAGGVDGDDRLAAGGGLAGDRSRQLELGGVQACADRCCARP